MKKEFKIALKSLAIKARVYNFIRTTLFNKSIENISDKEKVEFFNQIFDLNKIAHKELNSYKAKRQYKNKIHLLRELKKENV